jgi:hypothetical protein
MLFFLSLSQCPLQKCSSQTDRQVELGVYHLDTCACARTRHFSDFSSKKMFITSMSQPQTYNKQTAETLNIYSFNFQLTNGTNQLDICSWQVISAWCNVTLWLFWAHFQTVKEITCCKYDPRCLALILELPVLYHTSYNYYLDSLVFPQWWDQKNRSLFIRPWKKSLCVLAVKPWW